MVLISLLVIDLNKLFVFFCFNFVGHMYLEIEPRSLFWGIQIFNVCLRIFYISLVSIRVCQSCLFFQITDSTFFQILISLFSLVSAQVFINCFYLLGFNLACSYFSKILKCKIKSFISFFYVWKCPSQSHVHCIPQALVYTFYFHSMLIC